MENHSNIYKFKNMNYLQKFPRDSTKKNEIILKRDSSEINRTFHNPITEANELNAYEINEKELKGNNSIKQMNMALNFTPNYHSKKTTPNKKINNISNRNEYQGINLNSGNLINKKIQLTKTLDKRNLTPYNTYNNINIDNDKNLLGTQINELNVSKKNILLNRTEAMKTSKIDNDIYPNKRQPDNLKNICLNNNFNRNLEIFLKKIFFKISFLENTLNAKIDTIINYLENRDNEFMNNTYSVRNQNIKDKYMNNNKNLNNFTNRGNIKINPQNSYQLYNNINISEKGCNLLRDIQIKKENQNSRNTYQKISINRTNSLEKKKYSYQKLNYKKENNNEISIISTNSTNYEKLNLYKKEIEKLKKQNQDLKKESEDLKKENKNLIEKNNNLKNTCSELRNNIIDDNNKINEFKNYFEKKKNNLCNSKNSNSEPGFIFNSNQESQEKSLAKKLKISDISSTELQQEYQEYNKMMNSNETINKNNK